MSHSSFRQHFRLSRPTAQRLVNILGTCPEIPVPRARGRPTVEIELLITVWYLGNPECIRSVSDRFDVSRSTVLRVTSRIFNAPFSNSLIIHQFTNQSGYANLVRCVWFETPMKHWTEAFPR